MQYYIEAIDVDDHSHKLGVGRYWFAAKRAFEQLPKHELKQAKLMITTDNGHKLNTVIRWPRQERSAA